MDQYTQTPLGQHSYDTNGNLVAVSSPIGQTVYRYDYAGRLVQVDVDDGVGSLTTRALYAYDALGRRISKTSVGSGLPPTEYVYDDGVDDDCDGILEVRLGGGLNHKFVHIASTVSTHVRIDDGGTIRHYLCDDLDNVVALTDEAGNVVERYEYDDYGTPTFLAPDGRPLVDPVGTPLTASPEGNPFLFRGMQWDGETGLYLDQSRYFDPKTAQYASRDHRGGAIGQSRRTFANNNPWSASTGESGSTRAHESRGQLKSYFENGDVPTQDQSSSPGGLGSRAVDHRGHVTVLK